MSLFENNSFENQFESYGLSLEDEPLEYFGEFSEGLFFDQDLDTEKNKSSYECDELLAPIEDFDVNMEENLFNYFDTDQGSQLCDAGEEEKEVDDFSLNFPSFGLDDDLVFFNARDDNDMEDESVNCEPVSEMAFPESVPPPSPERVSLAMEYPYFKPIPVIALPDFKPAPPEPVASAVVHSIGVRPRRKYVGRYLSGEDFPTKLSAKPYMYNVKVLSAGKVNLSLSNPKISFSSELISSMRVTKNTMETIFEVQFEFKKKYEQDRKAMFIVRDENGVVVKQSESFSLYSRKKLEERQFWSYHSEEEEEEEKKKINKRKRSGIQKSRKRRKYT